MKLAIFRFFTEGALGGGALAIVLVGCGGGGPSPEDMGTYGPGTSIEGGACTRPAPGCACATPGVSAACGRVDRVSGNYVSCSMGMMACNGGVWGACIGDRITTKKIPGSGIHALNYGAAGGGTHMSGPLRTQTHETPHPPAAGARRGPAPQGAARVAPTRLRPVHG